MEQSLLGSLLIKYSGGLITTEKQARYTAIIAIVLMVVFSLFLFMQSGSSEKAQYEKNIQIMENSIGATNAPH